MKKIFLFLLISTPLFVFSQKDSVTTAKQNPNAKTTYFGVKAGLNFSNVTNASSISASNQTGWHAGILANLGGKLICFRLEVLYSQQGYGYSTDSSSGAFTHQYISMSQLIGINITHFVQLQFGGQTGYLLNAKATNKTSTGNATADNILSYYNRFDYGYGGGIEIHPIAGLLIGARYNISLSNLYNNTFSTSSGGSYSTSTPSIDFKNNVVQIFAGWKF
ncbi:MAG TPA: porin family protein [Puia sp.]|nr:porin family protein [Puia sp.]